MFVNAEVEGELPLLREIVEDIAQGSCPDRGDGAATWPAAGSHCGKIGPKSCMQCYCILDIVYIVYGILCTVFTGRVSGRSYCVLFLVAVFQAVFQAVLLYTVHRTYCTLLGLKKVDPQD